MGAFKSPVLLIGFNRPDFLKTSLSEILTWQPPHIYVSLDGPKTDSDKIALENINSIISSISNFDNITIWRSNKNIGLSLHITQAISKVLEVEENIIVLEDDIRIFYNSYISMSEILYDENVKNFSIVSGFSSIPAPPRFARKIMPNYFRTGIYTGMWGWGIRREIWKLFELDLSNLKIQTILNSSIFWKKISSRQKNIWENRFNKVCSDPLFTWDFQMQFLVFRYDLPVLSPFFRSLDNIGFNSELSTHTKDKKPKYYFGETDYRCIKGVKRSKLIFKIMNYCDSFSDLIPFLKKNSVLKYFLTK